MLLEENEQISNPKKMKTDQLEDLSKRLNKIYENLKAEVIVAELQKNTSLTSSNITTTNQSTFRRSHRRDVLNVSVKNDTDLDFSLSRNGLYDQLPEGVFHSLSSSKNKTSYSSLRKKYKEEEKDARHFFSPLENEFFQQTLNIEVNEQELFSSFSNLDHHFLSSFWKIKKNIPKNLLLKLLKLLPHSYKIVGNIELTALCLEKIINKNVSIKKTYVNNNRLTYDVNSNFILGVDFSLENNDSVIYNPAYEITIGPIEEHEIDKFINKKSGINKLISIFYNYFVPLEIETKTKFNVNHKNGFTLSNDSSPVMGMSTLI